MTRIKWNHERIKEWIELNRPDITFIETKIEKKQRLAYVEYNNKEGWVQWGNIYKGFDPSFKTQTYTTESFSKVLKENYPHIELLGDFTGIKTLHKFYCKECSNNFEKTPANVLASKYGCNGCYIREKGKNRLRTQEEFEQIILNLIGNEYSVLGKYIHSETKILFKHNKCNKEFHMKPNNFVQGQRCPHCAKENHGLKKRKSHDDFINTINEKYPNKYTILSKYEVQSKKIKVMYNDCGHIKMVNPNSISRGFGCDECAKLSRKEKRTKSKEQFELELNLKFPDRFEILKYNKQSGELKVLHNDCNNIFYRKRGTDLLENGSCDFCNMSSQEETVKNVLEYYKIKFTTQKTFDECKNIKLLRFDFYLEDLNILLEVQGRQHYTVIKHFGGFEGFMERKFNDIRKKVFCKNNSILLLELPYWENEFKKVKNILKEYEII